MTSVLLGRTGLRVGPRVVLGAGRSAACSRRSATSPRRRRSTRRGSSACARSTPRRTTAPACRSGGVGAALRERPRDELRALHQGRPAAGRPGQRGRRAGFAEPSGLAARVRLQPRRRAALARGVPRAARARPHRHGATCTTPRTTSTWRSARRSRRSCELRDEGVIRAIGAGSTTSAPLLRFVREADLDCVLVAGRYTLLDQGAVDELLPLCRARRRRDPRRRSSSTAASSPTRVTTDYASGRRPEVLAAPRRDRRSCERPRRAAARRRARVPAAPPGRDRRAGRRALARRGRGTLAASARGSLGRTGSVSLGLSRRRAGGGGPRARHAGRWALRGALSR